MANEFRLLLNGVQGVLTSAASASDTTINADALASLGGGYNSTVYTPLTLYLDQESRFEIVWVVGHGAGSQQATVLRGREGTVAQVWPAGTRVRCAPTVWDALTTNSPSGTQTGHRTLDGSTGITRVRRNDASWGPDVGRFLPSDLGPGFGGTAVPANAQIREKRGRFSQEITTAGTLVVAFPTAFPTACHSVIVQMAATGVYAGYVVNAGTASNFTMTIWRGDGSGTPSPAPAGTTVTGTYDAVGY